MIKYEPQEILKGLHELREFVLETRRAAAGNTGDKEVRVKSVLECQQALNALDEAIAEETRVAFPMKP